MEDTLPYLHNQRIWEIILLSGVYLCKYVCPWQVLHTIPGDTEPVTALVWDGASKTIWVASRSLTVRLRTVDLFKGYVFTNSILRCPFLNGGWHYFLAAAYDVPSLAKCISRVWVFSFFSMPSQAHSRAVYRVGLDLLHPTVVRR